MLQKFLFKSHSFFHSEQTLHPKSDFSSHSLISLIFEQLNYVESISLS